MGSPSGRGSAPFPHPDRPLTSSPVWEGAGLPRYWSPPSRGHHQTASHEGTFCRKGRKFEPGLVGFTTGRGVGGVGGLLHSNWPGSGPTGDRFTEFGAEGEKKSAEKKKKLPRRTKNRLCPNICAAPGSLEGNAKNSCGDSQSRLVFGPIGELCPQAATFQGSAPLPPPGDNDNT